MASNNGMQADAETARLMPGVKERDLLVTNGRKVALTIAGTTALLVSAYGVYYTLSYLAVLHSEPPGEETPYFREAYYPMLSICLGFYALLAFFGAQFWQLKTRLRFWFLGLLIAELGYVVSLGFLWRLDDEKIALSIAAAPVWRMEA